MAKIFVSKHFYRKEFGEMSDVVRAAGPAMQVEITQSRKKWICLGLLKYVLSVPKAIDGKLVNGPCFDHLTVLVFRFLLFVATLKI